MRMVRIRMEERMKRLIVILLTLIMISGCTTTQTDSTKLQIVTSIYPMTDFTKKIVGDKAEVTQLIPLSQEAHSWEPSAQDIVTLEKADVFVYNGHGMEHWVDKVLDSLDNKDLVIIESSKAIEALEVDHHDDHDHGTLDPHTWVSPLNALEQTKAIANGIIQIDQKNKEFYQENLKKITVDFQELDQEYRNTISTFKKKEFVVTHEAFGYLANDYGLIQIGIEGIAPTSEPDPTRIAQIIQLVKEHGITTIFFEELVNPAVAKTIATEANVFVDSLNPLGTLSSESIKNNEDYFSVMRKNLKALKKALHS